MGKSDSQQMPNKLLIGFQQTQPGCNLLTSFVELFWRDHLMSSKWTQGQLPADSLQTMSTQFRELIKSAVLGEPFWRAHIKNCLEVDYSMDSTNQTPNKALKDFSQVLIYILHLEILIRHLMWRALLKSSFGETMNFFDFTKHKIQLNFLDFSCQKANLIWKNMISNM